MTVVFIVAGGVFLLGLWMILYVFYQMRGANEG